MQTAGRKTPTPKELGVWREFVETVDRLNGQLAARMLRASSVSATDYQVLLALSESSGHRYRSSELADQIGWERSRLSHHLGRMERRGLITRAPCADDSRGSEVILTSEGAEAFRRCSAPHLRDIRELFIDAFSPEQLDALATASAALKDHLDRVDTK